MEKINYGFVIDTCYPGNAWSVKEGRKAYEYDAYIWDSSNNVELPTKEDLDEKWQIAKRETHVWKEVIAERNIRLRDSDHYVLPDYPHASDADRQAWVNYRQALRDLTTTAEPTVTEENKVFVEWPAKP
jgi:hypothetical protein